MMKNTKYLKAIVGEPFLCKEAGFDGNRKEDTVVSITYGNPIRIKLQDGNTVEVSYDIIKGLIIDDGILESDIE